MAYIRKESTSTPELNQDQLLTGFKNNDRAILKYMYHKAYPAVRAFILRNSGSEDEARDIYQEAFTASWRNVRRGDFELRAGSSIEAYLVRIAKNKWMDKLKSSQHRKTVVSTDMVDSFMAMHVEADEDDASLESQRNLMKQAFARLGDSCQQLLADFYFNNLSMQELAKQFDITFSSVRNKKYRCMETLRQLVWEMKNDHEEQI